MSKPAFPQDAAGFKQWADDACRTWPEHLTAAAYWAHAAMDKRVSNTEYVDDFATAYADYRKSQEVA